jgi:hypothetical protein
MKKLEIQQKRKEYVLAEKKKLEDSLAEVRQKKDAQQEFLKMAKKVNGARQLLESLKGEKKRWTENSNRFDQEKR